MSKTFQCNVNRKTKPYGITFKNGHDSTDQLNIVINKSKERRKNKLKPYQYEIHSTTNIISTFLDY